MPHSIEHFSEFPELRPIAWNVVIIPFHHGLPHRLRRGGHIGRVRVGVLAGTIVQFCCRFRAVASTASGSRCAGDWQQPPPQPLYVIRVLKLRLTVRRWRSARSSNFDNVSNSILGRSSRTGARRHRPGVRIYMLPQASSASRSRDDPVPDALAIEPTRQDFDGPYAGRWPRSTHDRDDR